jgi:hypothetical protein
MATYPQPKKPLKHGGTEADEETKTLNYEETRTENSTKIFEGKTVGIVIERLQSCTTRHVMVKVC